MGRSVFQSGKSKNTAEKEQKDVVQGKSGKKVFNQLLFCRPYPLQSSVYFRIIVTLFFFVFSINLLLTFKFLVGDPMFLGINIESLKWYLNSQLYIWFGVNSLIKIAIISSIVIQIIIGIQKQQSKILFSMVQKFNKFQRVFIQLDLQLSSLLLLSQSSASIISFLLSILIILFSLVFLQNYSEQKDRFYIGNFYYFAAFRLILVLGALSNMVCLLIGNSTIFFMIYHTCASILIIALYLLKGWIVFKDSVLRWGLLTFIALYFALSINLLVYIYCVPRSESFIIHCILTLMVTEMSLYFKIKQQQVDSINSNSKIQEQCFTIFNLLQTSYFQPQQKAFIAGLLKSHSSTECSNQKCYTLLNELYDSKKFRSLKNDDFINERASLCKFYLQCKFQTYLQSNPKDDRALMSYCELLYWKFKNINRTIYWLGVLKLHLNQSSFGTLIKFNGLVEIIKKDNKDFCALLYNKNLDIEHLIDAQDTYQTITSSINIILRERLQSWRLIEKQQIDLSLIRSKIQPTFTDLVSISQNWKKISKYLKQSYIWKQQYLFFILYVKNQKLKNKVLEEFESKVEKDIDLSAFVKKNSGFQLKSLFSQDTCCINVYLNDSKAFIKRVSNNFTMFTEYTSEEVLNASIDILLPTSSARYHQQLLYSLSTQGKFLDQNMYRLSEVYIVNKSGFIIPVMKIFKEFVNEVGQLEYICFLKKVQIKQVRILCNKYFQVQHFTHNFIETLQISHCDSPFYRQMNLLSMIPKLTTASIFDSGEDNPNLNEVLLQSQETVVEFQYSKNGIAQYCLFYQQQLQLIDRQNLTKYLEVIRSLETQISSEGIKLQLNIVVNSIINPQCKYYQVRINHAQLKKQLKEYSSTLGKDINYNYKFGMTSTTASSKNIRSELTKKDRIKQSNQSFTNIFIKEQGNEAPLGNLCLSSLKKVWLVFLFLLAIVINTNLFLLSSRYVEIEQFSIKIQSVLQINSLSSNILAYYQSYLLNATTFAYIKPKIKSFTASLQTAVKNKKYQQVLFDKSINTPGIYYPLTPSLPMGNFSYNQIDLNFFIQSLYHSLALQNNLTVDSYNYKLLINYYYPSFITLTNNTKSNLHQSFKKNTRQISNSATITYSIQSLLFLALVISSIFISVKFFGSMLQMMKIHCQFNPQDIKRIVKYYKRSLAILNHIHSSNGTDEGQNTNLSNLGNQYQQIRQNNNLNKKSKDIYLGKGQINQYIAYSIKVTVCILLLMGFSYCSIYYLNSLVQPIVDIQAYGYNQFLYNPNRIITSLLISNQYIYPSALASKSIYRQIMSNAFIQSNIPYIAAPLLNTKFYTYVQNVYFTNLCRLFLNTLKANNFSLSQCESIADSSFTRGTISYSGFQYHRIDRIYTYNQTLTAKEIKQFYRSLQFSRLFFSNLVSIWQTQIFDLCEWSLFVIRTMVMVLNIVIVMVMIFSFVGLFSYLQKEYIFYKQFYRNMMPQYIISGQKIIKSKLTVISFL